MANNHAQRDKARIKLAFLGIGTLYDAPNPLLLKDIFILPQNSTATEFQEATGSQARKWQRRILDQLVDEGLVKKTLDDGQQCYAPADKKRLNEILNNYADYDGSMLSALVFPKKPAGKQLEEVLRRHLVDEDGAAATAENARTEENSTNQLLEPVQADNRIGSLIDSFHTLIEAVASNHRQFDSQFNGLSDRQDEVLGAIDLVQEKVEQKDRSITKRIDQMEQRMAALQTVIEAVQRTLKTTMSSIEELTKTERYSAELVTVLSNLHGLITGLNANVLGSMQQNAAMQKDKWGHVLRRLDANIAENGALRNLFLENMANDGYEQAERAAIQAQIDMQNGKQT
jgi:hypothetical protein